MYLRMEIPKNHTLISTPIRPMLGVPLPPPHGPSQNPTVYKSTTANAFKASLFQAFR